MGSQGRPQLPNFFFFLVGGVFFFFLGGGGNLLSPHASKQGKVIGVDIYVIVIPWL